MDLKTFVHSIKRGEILIPKLRQFLEKQQQLEIEGKRSHGKMVIRDARMTIDCFQKRIEAYQEEIDENFRYFHPSQLGSCFRASWFAQHNAPRKKEETNECLRSHLTFEIGTYAHVMFQNLCAHAKLLEKREVSIQDKDLRILGHADGILLLDDVRYLLEIKTSNSSGFIRLTQPHEAHKRQVTAYMRSLNLKWAIFVYIDKDRSQLKEFVFPYDEQYFQEHVKGRIDYYFEAMKGKKPPEREGNNPNTPPCRYCPFTEICFDTRDLKNWQLNKKAVM